MRYITKKELETNPKEIFGKGILRQLPQWRGSGERMVLIMNANKDVLDRVMCRQLKGGDIGMREAVYTAVGARGPNAHFKGTDTINGIWETRKIEVSNVAYLHVEIGDHWPVIANISEQSLIG